MAARKAATRLSSSSETLAPGGEPADARSPKNGASDDPARFFVAPVPGNVAPIEPDFAQALHSLQQELGQPVVLFVHPKMIDDSARDAVRAILPHLPKGKPVTLLVDSPGGYTRSAYQIASMLRRHCGSFTAVVPRYAKSAATLLCLGASRILMSPNAELGPLDPQLVDRDSENQRSALDETLPLERLNAFALEVMDRTMIHLINRTGKRLENLLPKVMSFAVDLTKPLLEKMDPIRYTAASRALKISEEYAVRLLRPHFPRREQSDKAAEIANHLTHRYPEHGFPIEYPEAHALGLHVELLSDKMSRPFDDLGTTLAAKSYVGLVLPLEKNSQP